MGDPPISRVRCVESKYIPCAEAPPINTFENAQEKFLSLPVTGKPICKHLNGLAWGYVSPPFIDVDPNREALIRIISDLRVRVSSLERSLISQKLSGSLSPHKNSELNHNSRETCKPYFEVSREKKEIESKKLPGAISRGGKGQAKTREQTTPVSSASEDKRQILVNKLKGSISDTPQVQTRVKKEPSRKRESVILDRERLQGFRIRGKKDVPRGSKVSPKDKKTKSAPSLLTLVNNTHATLRFEITKRNVTSHLLKNWEVLPPGGASTLPIATNIVWMRVHIKCMNGTSIEKYEYEVEHPGGIKVTANQEVMKVIPSPSPSQSSTSPPRIPATESRCGECSSGINPNTLEKKGKPQGPPRLPLPDTVVLLSHNVREKRFLPACREEVVSESKSLKISNADTPNPPHGLEAISSERQITSLDEMSTPESVEKGSTSLPPISDHSQDKVSPSTNRNKESTSPIKRERKATNRERKVSPSTNRNKESTSPIKRERKATNRERKVSPSTNRNEESTSPIKRERATYTTEEEIEEDLENDFDIVTDGNDGIEVISTPNSSREGSPTTSGSLSPSGFLDIDYLTTE